MPRATSLIMYLVFIILTLYTQFSHALRGSNFDFSRQLAAKYACNGKCYHNLHSLNALDTQYFQSDFDFDFYATASNFSTSEPGDLLKLGLIDPDTLSSEIPKNVTYYRFQYTSVDIDNRRVPVTGFIAIPNRRNPNQRQYRAVSFAHGTLGVWHGCAPTADLALYDSMTWSPLVNQGYAIIATDYSGSGNNYTEHKYLALPEHANDVFYAMIAARQAFGSILSREWISWGHSQGGGAVWKLAESDLLHSPDAIKAGKYLGTVALAPVTKLYDMTVMFSKMALTDENAFRTWELTPWLEIAVKRLIPWSSMNIYGEVMRKRLQLIEIIQACYNPVVYLSDDLSIDETFATLDFTRETGLQLQQNMTAPGNGGRGKQPLLVIQGTSDKTIPTDITVSTFKDSCANGNQVHLRTHDDIGHNTLFYHLFPLYLNWMDSLFNQAGEWTPGRCTQKHFTAADVVNMDVSKEVSELNSADKMQHPGLLAQPGLEL